MSHRNKRNDGENDNTSQSCGNYQLDSYPCWFVQSLKVTKGAGLHSCRGSLLVLDKGFDQPQEHRMPWTAERLSEGNWEVVGQPVFDTRQNVDFELRRLVQDKLKSMVREGTLSNAPIKQTADDQVRPPAPSAPPAPKPPVPPASSRSGFAVAVMKDGKGATPPVPPKPPPTPTPPTPPPASPSKPTADALALPGAIDITPPLLAVRIPVALIRPNPDQPRKHFRNHGLRELAKSLKDNDQRQPVEVIRVFDPVFKYELVCGERRLRAAKIAGLVHLNAIVKDAKEVPGKKEQFRLCVAADCQSEGYTKLETSGALMRMKADGATNDELCSTFGRSIAWVIQHLALNDLVPELKELLDPSLPRCRQLSFTIGCRLARVPKERQMEIYREVMKATGSRLRLITVNKLLAGIVTDKRRGRKRLPSDYVFNLSLIAPRLAADGLTADGFPNSAFTSLVENKPAEAVATMLDQVETAMTALGSLKRKIQAAIKQRRPKK